jgi:hypothetical protein
MTRQFFTCEMYFSDLDGARVAIAELGELGIESKIFDVEDPIVFGVVWRAGDSSFEEIIREIVERHGGSVDYFGVSDHVPVPSDFGFAAGNGRAL